MAVVAAGEALKDLGDAFWNSGGMDGTVKDWRGNVVCELNFSGKR
jgi:hypothetical protein